MNLGKWTEYPSFDTFGDEVEDFEELGPEMETSDRDLSFCHHGMGGQSTEMTKKMRWRLKIDFSIGREDFR